VERSRSVIDTKYVYGSAGGTRGYPHERYLQFSISVALGTATTLSVANLTRQDVIDFMRLTDGRGVAVAIEALGTQSTFEPASRVLRPRAHNRRDKVDAVLAA
jgi:hypothetical protein